MIVGFTGTRDGMKPHQIKAIKEWIHQHAEQIEEAHHGDCVGADEEFHDLVRGNLCPDNITIVIHPPVKNIKRAFCDLKGDFGKKIVTCPVKPYLERNDDIAESDILLAAPKDLNRKSGTWYTIRKALENNNEVIIFL